VIVPDFAAEPSDLNRAERAFVDAVLVCHGVFGQPAEAEFKRALQVMVEYAQQVQDNPADGTPSALVKRWLAPLSKEDKIRLAAAAFVRFGVTKPSIFQIRAAHREVFGIDLDADRS